LSAGKFRQYDYGIRRNKKIYGKSTPPEYDLRKVTAPVALHYSANDMLAAIVVSITCHVRYSQDESPFSFLVHARFIAQNAYIF
jgi:hypothetical protein